MASLSSPVNWALDLRRGKCAEAKQLFFIEGRKAAIEAVQGSGVLRHAFMTSEAMSAASDLAPLLTARGVACSIVPERALARLAHTRTPQGVVLIAERPHSAADNLVRARRALAVYLDTIQDPGNVGAVIRAAHALGATHVVCGGATADPFSPKSSRASAGAALAIPIVMDSVGSLPRRLRAAGYRLVAAEPAATSAPEDSLPLPPRTLLVLGSEGLGISPSVRELCHDALRIPMTSGAESLNVGQAAAVILYAWQRQR